jgi:hypothetical protein
MCVRLDPALCFLWGAPGPLHPSAITSFGRAALVGCARTIASGLT